MKRIHIYISGRVQFVGFRYYVKRKAVSLGLKGWVKNLPDGRVECSAEGLHDKLIKLIDFCKKGPFFSRVDNVSVKYGRHTGKFSGFEIIM